MIVFFAGRANSKTSQFHPRTMPIDVAAPPHRGLQNTNTNKREAQARTNKSQGRGDTQSSNKTLSIETHANNKQHKQQREARTEKNTKRRKTHHQTEKKNKNTRKHRPGLSGGLHELGSGMIRSSMEVRSELDKSAEKMYENGVEISDMRRVAGSTRTRISNGPVFCCDYCVWVCVACNTQHKTTENKRPRLRCVDFWTCFSFSWINLSFCRANISSVTSCGCPVCPVCACAVCGVCACVVDVETCGVTSLIVTSSFFFTFSSLIGVASGAFMIWTTDWKCTHVTRDHTRIRSNLTLWPRWKTRLLLCAKEQRGGKLNVADGLQAKQEYCKTQPRNWMLRWTHVR